MTKNPKKVNLKLEEYKEVFDIFKGLSSSENIPTFEKFKENLDNFIELTFDAYISNIGSKDKSMQKWIKFIGSRKIALDFFHAVDKWHAYT